MPSLFTCSDKTVTTALRRFMDARVEVMFNSPPSRAAPSDPPFSAPPWPQTNQPQQRNGIQQSQTPGAKTCKLKWQWAKQTHLHGAVVDEMSSGVPSELRILLYHHAFDPCENLNERAAASIAAVLNKNSHRNLSN